MSGWFRTRAFGEAYSRISNSLQSMAERRYDPLVAIQIALTDNAVETLKQYYGPTPKDA